MISRKRDCERIRLRDHLTFESRCRYILWRLGWTDNEIWVTIKTSKAQIALRRGTHDAHIAREIFAEGQYDFPNLESRSDSVRCIIDVGANVGYSITHLAMRYPQAMIHAFEPIREHVGQIRKHIERNNLTQRVLLHASAAGVKDDQSWIYVDGAGSSMAGQSGVGMQRVQVIDWYNCLPECEIDLITMDVEGAEIELLADPRFTNLASKTDLIALEWHAKSSVPHPREWCNARLRECGFETEDGDIQYGIAGTLIARNTSKISFR